MKTDLERKLFLASKLPKLIEHRPWTNARFWWKSLSHGYITEREWDWVVKEVESQLGDNLIKQTEAMFNPPFNMSIEETRAATWQQRTDALMQMENNQ